MNNNIENFLQQPPHTSYRRSSSYWGGAKKSSVFVPNYVGKHHALLNKVLLPYAKQGFPYAPKGQASTLLYEIRRGGATQSA